MYRVDKRKFEVGQTIQPPPTSYHENGLSEKGIVIEQVLESTRPKEKILKRSEGLFIFRDLCDAMAFHQVMSGSNIYQVEPTENTILYHKGDMNFTEVMNHITDEDSLTIIGQQYWKSAKTFKPCWELIFNEMRVKEVLNTTGLKAEYYSSAGHFEVMPWYRKALNSRFAVPEKPKD